MDVNQVRESANHAAEKVRDAADEFAGTTKTQAEQIGRQAAVATRDAAAAVSEMVQQQPLAALLTAGLVGGLLTLLLTRR